MIKYILSAIVIFIGLQNISYAETYYFGDEEFKKFVSIQINNINSSDVKEKSCNGVLKDAYVKVTGRKSKTYINNELNNLKDNTYADINNQIDEAIEGKVSNKIPVLPNLYLGFTTNQDIVCKEAFSKFDSLTYSKIEEYGGIALGTAGNATVKYVTYLGNIYDAVSKKKVIDNPVTNLLLDVTFSQPQREAYVQGGSSYYQREYLKVLTEGLGAYAYIDKNDESAKYRVVIANKMAALQTCYIKSHNKKEMKTCLSDFSTTLVKQMAKYKKTKLTSSSIKKLIN